MKSNCLKELKLSSTLLTNETQLLLYSLHFFFLDIPMMVEYYHVLLLVFFLSKCNIVLTHDFK